MRVLINTVLRIQTPKSNTRLFIRPLMAVTKKVQAEDPRKKLKLMIITKYCEEFHVNFLTLTYEYKYQNQIQGFFI